MKIKLEGLTYTQDGFAMVHEDTRGVHIFEEISLESFPSCNDYKGSSTKVAEDDIAIILKFVGRPMTIGIDPRWFEYDVYEILVKGDVRQIFSQNIRRVETEEKRE